MRIQAKPITIKERHSILFLEKGQIDVKDGAFVIIDRDGIRTHIPVGGIACLMLEPGTRISHSAVALAAEVGCLLIWVGEGGVRLYASGQPGGARSDKLLYQAKLALDDEFRLKVVRAMYKFRFREEPPQRRSVDQLRGIEGVRVRELYKMIARQYGVKWKGRKYDPKNWDKADVANRCISAANHSLYGICEAAILAAGYAPAIGFIHTGKPQSFVYDIADLFKFETVIPIAFKVAKENPSNPGRETRVYCRNSFRKHKILKRLIPTIEKILSAGGIVPPKAHKEAVAIAIPNEAGIADAGHRN
ncbi:CRISPR-associated endonuclease Cas1 [subsurface metagenome]